MQRTTDSLLSTALLLCSLLPLEGEEMESALALWATETEVV